MSSRKLFISHSSKTDETHNLLHALGEKLRGSLSSYDVSFDQDRSITGGTGWSNQIDRWMAECHVAIILISKAVFDSNWVKKEAAILCWRKKIQPEFLVIPVLLGDIVLEDLEQGFFNVIGLTTHQCLRYNGDVDPLTHEIEKSLLAHQPFNVDWGQNQLGQTVLEILYNDFRKTTLTNAVTKLNLELPMWPLMRSFN